ncbi:HAD family hydrolase [Klugiella xanthotipulae]|uniref:Cof subfamily protein (Haloacid dehalogenase superfamily)/HAD superfamily hydrolase (TIGR01484 family) n=1 Tax=Klugiella xanthotipulae TaxID=244735 RepID=A0A543I6D7_9MICO|nr:HAD family hydrolase [Klugiella xanthotipulae]TQM66137.1 Cof subfamily protein (haloacid dehalogenase superfamily)/HAD superfamily hydrolase (TIGR01484 family) [Klugiella xanthotipulae]
MAVRRLIALDVDGTILHGDGRIAGPVREAVARVVSAGHEVTIATGRSVDATLPVVRDLGLDPEYIVCSNGAIVLQRDAMSAGGYRRQFVETFDPAAILTRVRPHLLNARYAVEDETGFYRYTEAFPDATFGGQGKRVPFEELLHAQATRVVVVSPDHRLEDFLQVVERMGLSQVSYAIGWTAWLDIAPEGVNKATALERVASLLGIADGDVVAVGDGRNDIEMLQWAGRRGVAAAMGQAPPDVQAAGNRVVGSIDEDGLAELLNSL